MTDAPNFKSTYAIVDVTTGRKKLEKYLAKGGGPIKVVLVGEIDRPSGSDDGTSIEFCMDVKSLTVID